MADLINDAFKWHDLCRRVFPTIEDARTGALVAQQDMMATTEVIFSQQLARGFEAVSPLTCDSVRLVEVVLQSEPNLYKPGEVYIEVSSSAWIRKTEEHGHGR